MARRQRNSERERVWRATMSRWRASGLSIRAFCQRHGLTQSAFYFWRRELRERDAAGAGPTGRGAAPTFVPVTVIPSTTAAIEVRCPSGHIVTLPSGDAAMLAMLFTALAAVMPC